MTMNSILTNTSVDAVLPRRPLESVPRESGLRRSISAGSRNPRQSVPFSLAETNEEVPLEADESMEDELLDAYFYGALLTDI